MKRSLAAAFAVCLACAGGLARAQTAPDPSVAPGADAAPSVAANRGKVPRGHSHAHHAHAHTAPGKAAAPSVKENQGDTGAPSTSEAKPGAGQGAAGADSAASVAHQQNEPK
jgi:hypothetical protein